MKEINYDNDLWIYEEVITNFEKDLSAIGNFEKFLKKEGYEKTIQDIDYILKDEKNEIIRKVKQVRKSYEKEKLKYEENSSRDNNR